MTEIHPLRSRYSSEEMQGIFSNDYKFRGWRRCWVALAESQRELGLSQIRQEFVDALKQFKDDIPYDRANELERELRHDVMAHILAYGEQVEAVCPGARGIIHLGATSMFPGDNTDLLQIRDGLDLVIGKTVNVLRRMKPFAEQHLETPCLVKTHYQPAQPTTYGKRITDWMYNLVLAFERVEYERANLKGRGVKGTTGTQDSFLKLFDGDAEKVGELDDLVSKRLGFKETYVITTQTYPRIVDYAVLSSIVGLSIGAKKMAGDLRLLQGEGEVSEPFRKSQVGSSAMGYKRNPMRAERATGLARNTFTGPLEAAMIASEQWLERTLDDSAQRRIVIADTFLGVDSVLNLLLDIYTPDTEQQFGLRIYSEIALNNLREQMPFIASEGLMMEAVKAGGDRQEIHELVRQCSVRARESIDYGGANNMLELMAEHPQLGVDLSNRDEILDPTRYVGTAPQQARRFIGEVVNPILEKYVDVPHMDGGVKV